MKVFSINGYWKEDKSEFNNYLVTDSDGDTGDISHHISNEEIFFHGLSELEIQEAINLKEETVHEFVITSYELHGDYETAEDAT